MPIKIQSDLPVKEILENFKDYFKDYIKIAETEICASMIKNA